jgi:hypothetical protein
LSLHKKIKKKCKKLSDGDMGYLTKATLPAIIAGLSLVTFSNSVSAASIAVSVSEITSFNMGASAGSINFTGFTFSNDTAATEGGGTGGADMTDAPAACIGDCIGRNNDFNPSASYSSEFSYGDAQILNADVQAGAAAASSIGELVVVDGIAHASGSNVMTSISLSVVQDTLLDFSFDADAYMMTSVTGTGLSSAANMFFNISLMDASNNSVFSWSPEELNQGIAGSSDYSFFGALSYSSAALDAGNYTLNIKMENQVNGAAVVPVPAAVWLFGSGLLGLVGIARRTKK